MPVSPAIKRRIPSGDHADDPQGFISCKIKNPRLVRWDHHPSTLSASPPIAIPFSKIFCLCSISAISLPLSRTSISLPQRFAFDDFSKFDKQLAALGRASLPPYAVKSAFAAATAGQHHTHHRAVSLPKLHQYKDFQCQTKRPLLDRQIVRLCNVDIFASCPHSSHASCPRYIFKAELIFSNITQIFELLYQIIRL